MSSYEINSLAAKINRVISDFASGNKSLVISQVGGSTYITMEDNR